jgi:hypothetical protein
MSEITRYVQGFDAKLHTYPTGDYVLYTDYIAALEAVKVTVIDVEPRQMVVDLLNNTIDKDELRKRYIDWEVSRKAIVPSPALEAVKLQISREKAEKKERFA